MSELHPASRTPFVSFGNFATQDMIRASPRFRCPLPMRRAFCRWGRLMAVGYLLPGWGGLRRSLVKVFAPCAASAVIPAVAPPAAPAPVVSYCLPVSSSLQAF